MANFLGFLFLGVLFVVLQGTLLAYVSVGGLRIELLIIIITYLALYHSLVSGCFIAVFLGYVYDLNSATPFGLHILSFLTCFLTLFLLRNRLYIHGPAFCIGLVTFMVVFHDFLQFFFLSSRGYNVWPSVSELAILFPKALLTGALWPLVSGPMHFIDRFFPLPYQPMKKGSGLEFKI